MPAHPSSLIEPGRNENSKIRLGKLVLFFAIALAGLLGPGAATVAAQDDPLQAIGIQPFSSQIPVQNGSVNVSNGDLHLEFPIVSLPQRGKIPLEIKIVYDSNLWYQQPTLAYAHQWGKSGGSIGSLAGWNLITAVALSAGGNGLYTPHNICHLDGTEDYGVWSKISMTTPDGVTHPFDGLTYTVGYQNACGDYTSMTTPFADAVADDGSGFLTTVTYGAGAMYAPDGQTGLTDSNGNYFVCLACLGTTGFTDTLGRNLITVTTNGVTNTMKVPNAGKNSGTSSYTVTYEAVNYYTNFGAGGYEASGSFEVIKSIQLPDGTSYSFTYDSGTTPGHYGDLLSMTLPTGSTINFTYANFFDSEWIQSWTHHVTRMLSTMTTPDGEWTFTPSVLTQCTSNVSTCEQQLQVTKPAYNGRTDNAVYKSLLPKNALRAYSIEADYYNGSVAGSNLMATINQSFDFSQTCSGPPWNLTTGCVDVTPLSRTVTLPTPSGTSINQTTQFCYDIVYGNLLKKWEWNFYTGVIIHNPNPPTSCSVYS